MAATLFVATIRVASWLETWTRRRLKYFGVSTELVARVDAPRSSALASSLVSGAAASGKVKPVISPYEKPESPTFQAIVLRRWPRRRHSRRSNPFRPTKFPATITLPRNTLTNITNRELLLKGPILAQTCRLLWIKTLRNTPKVALPRG